MNISEYKRILSEEFDAPHCGGTDPNFAEFVAPVFEEILSIAKPDSILEFGFNAGASALMFLMLDNQLEYVSVDLIDASKSASYLENKYDFALLIANSQTFKPSDFDLVFIDADHSYDAVKADIESALKANPKYILFDDVLHPSHTYIYDIIVADYRLELVKLYELNHLWQGYSMALCKVIN